MTPSENNANPGQPVPPICRRSRAFQISALLLIIVSGLAGTGLARWLRPAPKDDVQDNEDEKGGVKLPAQLFRDWEKPDLAIVVSGSQHGYLLPCGCSRPQKGGLERRYNFVQALREKGWAVAAVDVGDIAQLRGPQNLANVQGMLKYVYSMKALKKIGYAAVSFGEFDAGLGLEKAFAEYALNDPVPKVLAANLKNRDDKFPEMVGDWLEIKGLPIKTGVTASVGHTVANIIKNDDVEWEGTSDALNRVLPKMKRAGLDLRILLYQGFSTNFKQGGGGFGKLVANAPKPEAIRCAEAFPDFQVVLSLSEDDEPSANPIEVNGGKTLVVSLGHKGKYVGVIGVFKKGRGFELKYQLVELGEAFLTSEEKEKDHPIGNLMEEYTETLKDQHELSKFGQTKHPLQVLDPVPGLKVVKTKFPEYIGSERCQKCHEDAYEVWKDSKHSHAFQSLVDAKRPGNRQFDAECIVCHTVGFGYESGFASAKNENLKNVGCESCHGPGSYHANNPNSKEWRSRMNRDWKAAENEKPNAKLKRRAVMDNFCQKCHDIDNDVTWTNNAFDRKWEMIDHTADAIQARAAKAAKEKK